MSGASHGLQQFEAMMTALLIPQNAVRSQAEAAFNTMRSGEPDRAAQSLATILRQHADPTLRQQCAILLRGSLCMRRAQSFMWPRLSAQVQQHLKGTLLEASEVEQARPVRRAACDVVIEMGCFLCNKTSNQWPELAPKIFQMANAADEGPRESALLILAGLMKVLGEWVLSSNAQGFGQTMLVRLADTSPAVKSRAVALLAAAAQDLPKKATTSLQSLLGPAIDAIRSLCSAQCEQELRMCIEQLVAIAEHHGAFLKPVVQPLLELLSQVARARQSLDDGTRQLALEFIVTFAEKRAKVCLKHPGFVEQAVSLCVEFLLDVDDDSAAWATSFGDDYGVGEDKIYRLAYALGAGPVLPVVFAAAGNLIQDAAWQRRQAAMLLVYNTVEVVEEEQHVEQIGTVVLRCVQDPHPRVRWAALSALGEASKHHSPVFQARFAAEVLPLLAEAFKDQVPRVAQNAVWAFYEFIEMEADALLPYLPPIMVALKTTLQSQHRQVVEQTADAVGAVAALVKEALVPYYGDVVPRLKQLVTKATGKDDRELRGRALQCFAECGAAFGRERFWPDALEVMKDLAPVLGARLEDDDPLKYHIHVAMQHICRALGDKFLPFLQGVLPPIVQALSVRPQAVTDEQAEGGDLTMQSLQDGTCIGLKTTRLEEMESAISTLRIFLEVLGPSLLDSTSDLSALLLPLVEFHLSLEVRRGAALALVELLHALRGSAQSAARTPGLLLGLTSSIVSSLQRGGEDEIDMLSSLADALARALERAEPNTLSAEQVKMVVEAVLALVQGSFGRVSGLQVDCQVLDEDDEDQASERVEAEIELRSKYASILQALMRSHTGLFGMSLPLCSTLTGQLALTPGRPACDRALALQVGHGYLEHLGESAQAAWQPLLEAAIEAIGQDDDRLRQAGARCVRSASRLQAFTPLAIAAAAKLRAAADGLDNALRGKEYAAKVAAGGSMEIQEIQARCCTRDCMIAALFFLAVAPSPPPNLNTIWPFCLQHLPLASHHGESQEVCKLLLRLVNESSALVQGSALAPVLGALVDGYDLKAPAAEMQIATQALLRRIGAQQLQGMQSSLSQQQQRCIVKILA